MNKKRLYIQPDSKMIGACPLLPFMGSNRPTGYAIDNDEADDNNIIPIKEQNDDDLIDDFIDID